MTAESAADILRVADELGAAALRRAAKHFCIMNFDEARGRLAVMRTGCLPTRRSGGLQHACRRHCCFFIPGAAAGVQVGGVRAGPAAARRGAVPRGVRAVPPLPRAGRGGVREAPT